MSKHDEARENISFMDNKYDKAYKEMKRYITDMEAMEKHFIESEKKMRDDYFELLKKHNELKHDVKRYFELDNIHIDKITKKQDKEWFELREKLSKVGKEE